MGKALNFLFPRHGVAGCSCFKTRMKAPRREKQHVPPYHVLGKNLVYQNLKKVIKIIGFRLA